VVSEKTEVAPKKSEVVQEKKEANLKKNRSVQKKIDTFVHNSCIILCIIFDTGSGGGCKGGSDYGSGVGGVGGLT